MNDEIFKIAKEISMAIKNNMKIDVDKVIKFNELIYEDLELFYRSNNR